MAVSMNLRVLLKGFRLPIRGLGLTSSSFGADPYKNYIAVSMNRRVLFVGALIIGAFENCLGSI